MVKKYSIGRSTCRCERNGSIQRWHQLQEDDEMSFHASYMGRFFIW